MKPKSGSSPCRCACPAAPGAVGHPLAHIRNTSSGMAPTVKAAPSFDLASMIVRASCPVWFNRGIAHGL